LFSCNLLYIVSQLVAMTAAVAALSAIVVGFLLSLCNREEKFLSDSNLSCGGKTTINLQSDQSSLNLNSASDCIKNAWWTAASPTAIPSSSINRIISSLMSNGFWSLTDFGTGPW